MKSKSNNFTMEDAKNLFRSIVVYLGPQILASVDQVQSGTAISVKALVISVLVDGVRRYLKDNTK